MRFPHKNVSPNNYQLSTHRKVFRYRKIYKPKRGGLPRPTHLYRYRLMYGCMTCPYCNASAERSIGWYFDCANDHTFHIDDWNNELKRGNTV